jgi:hypothetical protein
MYRINWLDGVDLDGVFRGMSADEIKHVVARNPKNAKHAHTIDAMDTKYVRKAVGKAMGWTRRGMRRVRTVKVYQPTSSQPTTTTAQKRVTFRIAGCELTIPHGVKVEVL